MDMKVKFVKFYKGLDRYDKIKNYFNKLKWNITFFHFIVTMIIIYYFKKNCVL